MKAKRWIIAGCSALALGVLAAGALAQPSSSTSQVFQVEAKLSGVVLTNGFQAYKDILTSAGIINLARGRAMTSTVPTNEVLGLVVPCGEEAPTSLVVFDRVSSNSLVTVADINVEEAFEYTVSYVTGAGNSHQLWADAVLAADFGATGSASNKWTSGILAFPAHERLQSSGSCVVQGIGANTAFGNLKGISAGMPFAIVITKGTMISGQAWTVIEGPP